MVMADSDMRKLDLPGSNFHQPRNDKMDEIYPRGEFLIYPIPVPIIWTVLRTLASLWLDGWRR